MQHRVRFILTYEKKFYRKWGKWSAKKIINLSLMCNFWVILNRMSESRLVDFNPCESFWKVCTVTAWHNVEKGWIWKIEANKKYCHRYLKYDGFSLFNSIKSIATVMQWHNEWKVEPEFITAGHKQRLNHLTRKGFAFLMFTKQFIEWKMKLKIISRHGVDDRRVLSSEFDVFLGLEVEGIFFCFVFLFFFGVLF